MNPPLERFRERLGDIARRLGGDGDELDGIAAMLARAWPPFGETDPKFIDRLRWIVERELVIQIATRISADAGRRVKFREVYESLADCGAEAVAIVQRGEREVANLSAADADRVRINRVWQAFGATPATKRRPDR